MAGNDDDFVFLDSEDLSSPSSDPEDDVLLPLHELREWLDPTDYHQDGGEFSRHLASHLPNTNQWLLSTPEWKQWHDDDDSQTGLLRIVGIPGSGKSVVAAHLVHTLGREGVPVLFFFFRQIIDANHTAQALLRDWLAQLLPYSPQLQAKLSSFVTSGRVLSTVSTDDLWSMLRAGLLHQPKVYAVADALDEMDAGNEPFLRTLAEFAAWRSSAVKILTTSRPAPAVESAFRGIEAPRLRLDESHVDADIARFVSHCLASTPFSAEDQTLIREAVPGRANGLFLYAKLAMDSFLETDARVADVLARLPADLDCMYTDLLYAHARRSGISLDTQLRIVRWVTHASRPLRLLELSEVILQSEPLMQLDLKASKALVRASCGPLIEQLPDETLSVCHHSFTEFLKGWKRSSPPSFVSPAYPILQPAETHISLAAQCLRYLSAGCLKHQLPDKSSNRRRHKQTIVPQAIYMDFPFAAYAIRYWHVHIAKAAAEASDPDGISRLHSDIDRVLSNDTSRFVLMELALSDVDTSPNQDMRRLHVAAWAGLEHYTQQLLADGEEPNPPDACGDSPLHWAASYGHSRVVALLLRHHANPTPSNDTGLTPLHNAASRNRAAVVRLLLEAGVDPMTPKTKEDPGMRCGNSARTVGTTSLMYACQNGHVETVDVFLPFLTRDQTSQAYVWAASSNQLALVQNLLAQSSVNVDVKTCGDTALFRACSNFHLPMIRFLVQAGADPNASCQNTADRHRMQRRMAQRARRHRTGLDPERGTTPMHAFAHITHSYTHWTEDADHAGVISALALLLQAGGDVNALDDCGKTVLHHACSVSSTSSMGSSDSQVEFIRMLLDAGGDANMTCESGETPLHLCMDDSSGKFVRLLIEHGRADINKPDINGLVPLVTALSSTSLRQNCSAVFDLLKHRPDCCVVDNEGNTPLHLAFKNLRLSGLPQSFGSTSKDTADEVQIEHVITALLAAGADVNARNFKGETPLHMLSDVTTKAGLIQLLISNGASLETRDYSGQTVLFRVVQSRPRELRELIPILREYGAHLDTTDFMGRGLPHEVVRLGSDTACFEWLLAQGLEVSAVDKIGNSLLHEAALAHQVPCNFVDWQKLGIDPNRRNHAGQTPLLLACQSAPAGYDVNGQTFFDVLLRLGSNVNASDNHGGTPLHMAGCVSEVNAAKLLDAGADVTAITVDRLSALHLAARSRQSNIVGLLCDRIHAHYLDAKQKLIDATDGQGRTPLHHACRSGRVESVTALLRAGADPNIQDKEGHTPLSACAEFEAEDRLWRTYERTASWGRPLHIRQIELTSASRPCRREHGLSPNALRSWNTHRVENENDNSRLDEILAMLISHGADTAIMIDRFKHVLSDAMQHAQANNFDYTYGCLRDLRDQLSLSESVMTYRTFASVVTQHRIAAPIVALNDLGQPGIVSSLDHYELSCLLGDRHFDVVKKLVKGSQTETLDICKDLFVRFGYADLLGVAFDRTSVLKNRATESGGDDKTEAADHLSDQRRPPVHQDGKPLLVKACERMFSNLEVLKVLLKQADCQLSEHAFRRDPAKSGYEVIRGETALHVLANGSHWWQVAEALPLLLEAGADMEARNEEGLTPLHVALKKTYSTGYFHKEAARLLIQHGADVNAVSSRGQSCLAMTTDVDIVSLLVQRGARPSVPAQLAAIEQRNTELLRRLLSHGADANATLYEMSFGGDTLQHQESIEWLALSEMNGHKNLPASSMSPLFFASTRRFPQQSTESPLDRSNDFALIRALLEYGADPFQPVTLPKDSGTTAQISPLVDKDDLGRGRLTTIIHETFRCAGHIEPYLELPTLDVNLRDGRGSTLLLAACSPSSVPDKAVTISTSNHTQTLSVAEHLLVRGADVLARDNDGNNALHMCFMPGSNARNTFPQLLTRAPQLLTQANAEGNTPLHLALRMGDSAVIDELPLSGSDLKRPDSSGDTALHHAARSIARPQYVQSLQVTLEEAQQQYQEKIETATQVLHKYITLGVDVHARNKRGETAIFVFVSDFVLNGRCTSSTEFVSELGILLTAGACIHDRDNKDRTLLHVLTSQPVSNYPLHWKAEPVEISQMFEHLMGLGLDPLAEDDMQRTSLDTASANGIADVLTLFQRKQE